MKKCICLLASIVIAAGGLFAAPKNTTIKVWDGVKMPGNSTKPHDYSKSKWKPQITSVVEPKLHLRLVEGETPRAFVLISPGGGYSNLWSINGEGLSYADYFNKNGISAGVLEYRVPENFDGAMMDIQRAIRLVRKHAKEWNIDPNKIAVMGFSAGASLSARASTNFDKNSYEPIDDTDKLSARPDFTILMYPAYCSQPEKDRRFGKGGPKKGDDYNTRYAIADWNKVGEKTPEAFIAQTQPDIYVDASLAYYLALKDAGIPAELHMYPTGQHGGIPRDDVLTALLKNLNKRWK